MYEAAIGKQSERVRNVVERNKVKQFARVIGDESPIYIDEMAGASSRYGGNIAPPTYPRVFDYGQIDGLTLPSKGLIHGEQIYHYARPLVIGEDVYCYAKVADYKERAGKNGRMGIMRIENNGEDRAGKPIFFSTVVIIISEAAIKGMDE